ncbi:hypothetical protein SDC9_205106 [bioreactor metagenome]|uniref:Uncharacterized protein n=1 Tax=bioreactor metagenome TaxID=1076179 RepID=A0A645J2T7_9ZZZZ
MFPVGETILNALRQLVTNTFSFALLLMIFIFSKEVCPSIGISIPSFNITTFANTEGSSGFSKNSTVPSSCLIWNKLSTFAKGYFLMSSAKLKSSSPSSDLISIVTMFPAPAKCIEHI